MQEFALTAAITSLYNNILSCYDWRAQLCSLMASMKVIGPGACTLLSVPGSAWRRQQALPMDNSSLGCISHTACLLLSRSAGPWECTADLGLSSQ